MNRQLAGFGPVQHFLVKGLIGVSNVHDQNNARQRIAVGQVVIDCALPVFLRLLARLGIAVAGQVH